MFNDNLGDNNAKKLLTKFIDNGWILKSGDKGFSQYFLGEFKTDNSQSFNNYLDEKDSPF